MLPSIVMKSLVFVPVLLGHHAEKDAHQWTHERRVGCTRLAPQLYASAPSVVD